MRFHLFVSRVRIAVVFVAIATLLLPLSASTAAENSGTAGQTGQRPMDEDNGSDCDVPDPPGSAPPDQMLPDPFTSIDGTRISARSEWQCRRSEIMAMAEASIYGEKPDPPQEISGTVSSNAITVEVTDNGASSSFSAEVRLPSGSGPFPAVIVYGGFGADTQTILDSGAAVVNYDPLAVGAEGTGRDNKQGAFYDLYGGSSQTGILMAWAWGASRIIDVIERSDGSVLRADATGVTGCSRYGKGAFVAGAFDERIALTMPIESGTGGAPIMRGIPTEEGAQPLSSAYDEQPWLGDAFGAFTGDPSTLPVDTHQVVGMIAPRGLFLMENPSIDWLGARSGSVAALGGAEVYAALGAGENISYSSDVQDGTHCAVRPEWQQPMRQSIESFLLGNGNPPAVFEISPAKQGNLSEWRDWETPVLTD